MSTNIPFAQYLKDHSRATHDTVDELVMSSQPFANTGNYTRFLQLQALFHKVVDPIYKNPELNQKIAGLAELARYEVVLQDLHDLQAAEQAVDWPLPVPEGAEALGWLYCAEGSNVGAAFLFKDAQQQLNFNADFGARHLGPHADGRGKHWREFVEQLNALNVEGAERESALKGALDAFAFYKKALHAVFV